MARRLADTLGFVYLDTGAIYRAVALAALRAGVLDDDAAVAALTQRLHITFRREGAANRVLLNDEDVTDSIRTPEVSAAASRVSAIPDVRLALLDVQRRVAASASVVAEGRDCGTVVFPHASAKFFLTASPEERARRRAAELEAAGHATSQGSVMGELAARDQRDRSRSVAPLVKADDAVEIDGTGLDPEQVLQKVLAEIHARGA